MNNMNSCVFNHIVLIAFMSMSLLLVCLATPAQGQNATQCLPNETVFFSCSIREKVVSLCGSPDLSRDTGYLVYRFGRPGKTPELVYPQKGEKPIIAFSLYLSSYAKGSSTQVSFTRGRYTYTLYHESNVFDVNGSGISIEESGKRIAHLRCAEKSIIVGEVSKLKNIGLPESEFRNLP